MEIRTLWEILEDQGLPVGNLLPQTTVAITDPCMSRKDPETQARVRRIAKALGFTLEELPLHGSKAECCGYGGLVFNSAPAFAADILRHRTTPIDPPDTTLYGASASTRDYLAYCAMCRDNLVASGKRSSHLIEHLFPAMEGGDPASRGWISWSQRRRNRSRVKRRILQGLGVDPGQAAEAFATVTLLMTPEVRRLIDQRRILEEDLKRVIDHAERTGQRLINHQTEVSRAYFQSENVTFWVDYTPTEAGYTVHNAYCHRMEILGVKR